MEEIRIPVGGREEVSSSSDKLIFPFAVSTVFDEYSKTPVMFLDGKFAEVKPLSGEEDVGFPQPVGRNRCHYSIHSEIATLPLTFSGVRNVVFKLGVSERILKAVKPLIDAGMAGPSLIDVKGMRVSPRDFAIAYLSSQASSTEPTRHVALRTEVTGRRKGKSLRVTSQIVASPSEKLEVRNATGLLTGMGASIVAQMLIDGRITRRGAVPPEACVPPELFIKELEKRGIRVNTQESELLN